MSCSHTLTDNRGEKALTEGDQAEDREPTHGASVCLEKERLGLDRTVTENPGEDVRPRAGKRRSVASRGSQENQKARGSRDKARACVHALSPAFMPVRGSERPLQPRGTPPPRARAKSLATTPDGDQRTASAGRQAAAGRGRALAIYDKDTDRALTVPDTLPGVYRQPIRLMAHRHQRSPSSLYVLSRNRRHDRCPRGRPSTWIPLDLLRGATSSL